MGEPLDVTPAAARNEPRVLTAGETMTLLDPVDNGELDAGARLTLRIAGAESNFAIALARLDIGVAWISRLGADRLGDIVEQTLSGEGVDVRHVRRDAAAQTGVFFKWRDHGKSHVMYYRAGSAASHLTPDDVPDAALDGVELVHLTGITMALGEGPRALVVSVAERARARGITVLFDPNWRPDLWESPADAAASHAEVLPYADWYLCGEEEGHLLFGTKTTDALAGAVRAAGAGDAAVRIGARGVVVRGNVVPPVRLVPVRDEVGAGDGFAAGFAYGLLHGWDPETCARGGNVLASRALSGTGDWETFPALPDVEADLVALQEAGR
jgi:sugar/nucleoside kinase (ribokinase family)